MDPTLLPLLLLASAPQDAEVAPPPRVAAVAVARARIIFAARISFVSAPPPAIEPPPERHVVRKDGRIEIQFE
jgi:hypothetical protein